MKSQVTRTYPIRILRGNSTTGKRKSGLYKALEKQRIQIKSKLKTQLLNEHCAKNDSQTREDKIAMLTQQLNEIEEKMAQTERSISP